MSHNLSPKIKHLLQTNCTHSKMKNNTEHRHKHRVLFDEETKMWLIPPGCKVWTAVHVACVQCDQKWLYNIRHIPTSDSTHW